MKISLRATQPATQRTGCVIVGVFDGRKLAPSAEQIDESSKGSLQRILRSGDLKASAGSTLLLHGLEGVRAQRVLLVRLGARRGIDAKTFRKAAQAAAAAVSSTDAADALDTLVECDVSEQDAYWKAREVVGAHGEAGYVVNSVRETAPEPSSLQRLIVHIPDGRQRSRIELGIKHADAITAGRAIARDLGNLPGNICTPTHLADRAAEIARSHRRLRAEILNESDMKRLGMGALLGVSQGSRQPAKFIVMKYNGAARGKKPIVLVGKGVTFDSGGISLKPGSGMDEMKFDMCGAASVIGTMHVVASLGLELNVIALVPATENLPGGRATKPGDIHTSMSGKTIEILNTDAEGRLILCDALTYAEQFEPSAVIDVATLTGACVVALGHHPTGLFANHEALSQSLVSAGERTGDRVWPMPVWDEYQDQLKSNFADLANVGGRAGGAITAACFLSRFAEEFRWAHLDIAGTAWNTGSKKGSTGRPVPLLSQYLLDCAGAS